MIGIASVLPAVFFPSASVLSRVQFAIALWFVLVTAKIYFTGVTLARTRLLAARARADYYRRVVLPLRRQITEQTQLQYNGMLVGAFQLLQAKQAEVEAGIAYIDAGVKVIPVVATPGGSPQAP